MVANDVQGHWCSWCIGKGTIPKKVWGDTLDMVCDCCKGRSYHVGEKCPADNKNQLA